MLVQFQTFESRSLLKGDAEYNRHHEYQNPGLHDVFYEAIYYKIQSTVLLYVLLKKKLLPSI
jgi:hypothetical protein